MGRSKPAGFQCQSCGAQFPKWMGRCSQCREWNSVVELAGASAGSPVQRLKYVSLEDTTPRYQTRLSFLDRVLGGALPKGATLLLAGEPGIGKSTLLFQMMSLQTSPVLYVSAEESVEQVAGRYRSFKMRFPDELYVVSENRLEKILSQIRSLKPEVVVIDSIQMILSENSDKTKGSLWGVREATESLVEEAKRSGFLLWIVGHVNKDGEVAGPKTLEHLVDTVLTFQKAEQYEVRMVQVQKHRFGRSGEVAFLNMNDEGLQEKPAMESFWIQEHPTEVFGCAYASVLMGSRVYCVEVQALTVPTQFPSPRRSASGVDLQRLYLLLAVLEKRLKLPFSKMDVYLNVVGGLKVQDPALDLAVAGALVSAYSEKPIPSSTLFAAELGLTGELRAVPSLEARLELCSKLRKNCLVTSSRSQTPSQKGIIKSFSQVEEALNFLN